MHPHPEPPASQPAETEVIPQRHATPHDELEDGPLLRPEEVARLVTLDLKTIMRLVKSENFPEPLRLSERRLAWKRRDVRRWLANPHGWVNF